MNRRLGRDYLSDYRRILDTAAASSGPRPSRQAKAARKSPPSPDIPVIHDVLYRCSRRFWLALPIPAAVWYFTGSLLWTLAALYVGNSLLTYLWFYEDKVRARADWRRIPEKHLHIWELLGGWPGALLAQEFLRHKSIKLSYRLMLGLMVLLNLAALGAFFHYAGPRLGLPSIPLVKEIFNLFGKLLRR